MKPDLNTILLTLVTLVTALTPIILALINKKQGTMLVNSEIAKDAAVDTAKKVEAVRLQAVTAASKVEEVAKVAQSTDAGLTAKMEEIAKVGIDTHTLVNSNMGVQLRLNAAVTKRLADVTGDPDDRKASELASVLYAEHVAKQALVDSGVKQKSGTPSGTPSGTSDPS